MQGKTVVHFGPYRLEGATGQLWRGTRVMNVTPKAVAVLHYLIDHAGQLVTKAELLDAVWPKTYVSDGVLKVCVRELRHALQDKARNPRFIATVHGRGYRWIGRLTTAPSVSPATVHVSHTHSLTPHFVGREAELAQLWSWYERAVQAERHVVFVTGEAGIGKTTVVDSFVSQIEAQTHAIGAIWIGRGQCIEQYGAREAYLPVLEALGRLCRGPHGQEFIGFLRQHAPTWLVQMPALLPTDELAALQHRVLGATTERMLREMAEAVEVLAAEKPLVLVLEDLHWSDVATLELLATLARRREAARLLVIGTYRPIDVILHAHPLRTIKQELQVHGLCDELVVPYLSVSAVEAYLASRFANEEQAAPSFLALAHLLHERTEGNPLFLVQVIDDLVKQGQLVAEAGMWALRARPEEVTAGVPTSVQQMLERQIEQLDGDVQQVLEVASVIGERFATALVAAGSQWTVEQVEERCERIARHSHIIESVGLTKWPDGTVTGQYRFVHTLYQEVLYKRIGPERRARLHRQIGERLEAGYRERAREIATELAMHFVEGQDTQHAVQYLGYAGEQALRRNAHQEAIAHLTQAITLLKTLPDTPARSQQELLFQLPLGGALITTKGYAAPEVEATFNRALALCRQVSEMSPLGAVQAGIWLFYLVRGQLHTVRELARQGLTRAQQEQDQPLLLLSHHVLGMALYFFGEFTVAREHLEQSLALSDLQQQPLDLSYIDPKLSALLYVAHILWLAGYPDQALQKSQAALALAQKQAYPHSVAFARSFTATVHYFRGEEQTVRELAEQGMTLCREHGFIQWLAHGTILGGWALTEQQAEEGMAQIRQGLATWQAIGAELARTFFLALLAEVCGKAGQTEEGLDVLAEALATVDTSGERFYEAELYRLKGELLLAQEGKSEKGKGERDEGVEAKTEAEACFLKAIKIARRQQAKSLELRAVMSLSRLWQQQGKKREARRRLAEIYGWFTEGFDTADLQEAKALLEALV